MGFCKTFVYVAFFCMCWTTSRGDDDSKEKEKFLVIVEQGIEPCEGFENKMFNMDDLVFDRKDKYTYSFSGPVTLTRNTSVAVMMNITIYKKENDVYEYFANVPQQNICDNINAEDKQWTPFVKQMGVNRCPVPKNEYKFKEVKLSSDGYPVTSKLVGLYKVMVKLTDGPDVTCYIGYAKIIKDE